MKNAGPSPAFFFDKSWKRRTGTRMSDAAAVSRITLALSYSRNSTGFIPAIFIYLASRTPVCFVILSAAIAAVRSRSTEAGLLLSARDRRKLVYPYFVQRSSHAKNSRYHSFEFCG